MKAILVIDMPINCGDCDKLVRKGCQKGDYRKEERPNTCPLRPLPKRIPTNEYGYMTPYGSVWNACIDEILGETE